MFRGKRCATDRLARRGRPGGLHDGLTHKPGEGLGASGYFIGGPGQALVSQGVYSGVERRFDVPYRTL